MSQATCPMPVVVPTRRGSLQRLVDAAGTLLARIGAMRVWPAALPAYRKPGFDQAEADRLYADGLSAETLRDIGFAAWQVERQQLLRNREIERALW